MTIGEKLTQIAENAPKVYQAGYEKGKSEGGGGVGDYNQGYADGAFPMTKMQLQQSNFKDIEFPQGFELSLNVRKIANLTSTFQKCTGVKSIKIVAEEPNTVVAPYAFRETSAEIIDISGWNTKMSAALYSFYNAKSLKSVIGALDFSECTATPTSWLDQCNSLVDMEFVKETIKVSLNFNPCTKLSKASITSAVNGLNGSVADKVVTFSLTAVNKAFETSEGANDGSASAEWTSLVGTKTNWTISLT